MGECGLVVGFSPAQSERVLPDLRLFLHRIRRGDELLEATKEYRLKMGDVVAVTGRREVLVKLLGECSEEVEDRELLTIPLVTREVFLTSREWAEKILGGNCPDCTGCAASSCAAASRFRSVGTLLAGIVTGYIRST